MSDVSSLDALLPAGTAFTERPAAVPGDLRSTWRLALLSLVLDRCHGKAATLEQLHVVGWAVLDEDGRRRLRDAMEGHLPPDVSIVRFDPAWSRVVDLAIGYRLAEWTTTGRVKLTATGESFASEVWSSEGLTEERSFLADLRVSQALVDRMLERT